MPELSISLSKFEEIRFGVRSARALVDSVEQIEPVLEFCQKQSVKFLIVRVETQLVKVAQALEKRHFLLMDTLIYYRRKLSVSWPAPPGDIKISYATTEDLEEIQALASSTFKDYMNHYHADSRLDPARCDEVYIDWAARSCRKETADEMILAQQGDRIVGFLTLRVKNNNEVEGPLFAVSPYEQGKGIGSSLMLAGLDWAKRKGGEYFVIPTQITNRASQTLWLKLGFVMDRSYYTFHKWFDEE